MVQIVQPRQTTDIMQRVKLIRYNSMLSTLSVQFFMTPKDIMICIPYVHQLSHPAS